jgi:type VI secretion system protein ImpE
MSSATALELYYAGRLGDAIAAVTAEVRQKPTDLSARGFLCELLLFAGELERVDRQLEVIAQQEPTAMVGVALFRQLIRAEQARQQFFSEGRVPEFLDAPSPAVRLLLQGSICLREKQDEEATRLLAQAEAQRPRLAGMCDDKPFSDCRDIDDLTASVFEVLTTNGKYYWIPMDRVASIDFRPHERARDLVWRQARLVVRNGPDGEVYLPALYPGSASQDDERLRLGQMTDWRGGEGKPIRGAGQRMLQVGEEDRPFLELRSLTFQQEG